MFHKSFGILIFCLLLLACGKTKNIQETQELDLKKAQLLDTLASLSVAEWDFLSTKTNVKVVRGDQTNSVRTTLRMKKDSAFLLNISFAGIPIIQAALSQDSLRLVNRKDKCFVLASKDALINLIDFPFEYEQAQDLLTGKPISFDRSKEHILIQDESFYVLKTIRPRSSMDTTANYFITYYLSKSNLSLVKTEIESPGDSASAEIIYRDKHEKIEGLSLPKEIDIFVTSPQSNMRIYLQHNRPDVSSEKKITLNIPENYEACK
jgi:hypothetical protein